MSDPFSSDVYAVIDRLTRLRDLLCSGPQDVCSILTHLSGEYPRGESGKRAVRRDIRNLEVMGYQIQREGGHPSCWTLIAGPHMLSNADIDALTYIRETFGNNHPLAPAIQHLLTRLTRGLSDAQQPRWQRRPALRVPLSPVIDYSQCGELLHWLDQAIAERRQIAFLYRARGQSEPLLHPRLDPYDIEYSDRQFYLNAFSHQTRTVLMFRLDRIIWDSAQNSPRRLPNLQLPRQERRPIHFTYRLPASFADNGVSERFTTHSVRLDGDYVIVEASDPSELRIIRTLLGYGEHAVLLDGPPALLDRMRQIVTQMGANYGVHR